MTHQELKYKVQQSGLKPAQIAEKIGVHPVHLRSVLRGALPLTDKLAGMVESCIALKDNELKQVVAVFAVSVPDGRTTYHIHAPEKLSDTERQQVMQAMRAKIEEELGN